MITLFTLQHIYPQHYLTLRYTQQISESWTKGGYYLAGQVKLLPGDEITDDILDSIENTNSIKLNQCGGHMMDYMSLQRSTAELNELRHLVHLIRYNGIFKSIVFWLSPARKRATERVFHPSNLVISNGEIILKSLLQRPPLLHAASDAPPLLHSPSDAPPLLHAASDAPQSPVVLPHPPP